MIDSADAQSVACASGPSSPLTRLGFGAAAVGNLYRALDDGEATGAIEAALAAGMVWFDTAPRYGFGLSELRLGEVLSQWPRDRFRLSTKVGRSLVPDDQADLSVAREGFVSPRPYREVFDYGHDAVLRSIEESLSRLKVDRLDLVHVHDLGRIPHGEAHAEMTRAALDGAFPALVRLKEEGVVGGIGMGVNEVGICLDLIGRAPLDAILLAGRYTLLDAEAGERFLPLCEEQGVRVFLGGVFNSGVLAVGSTGPARYDYAPASPDVVERVRRLEAVCARHATPLPAAAIAFAAAPAPVEAVLLGLASPGEVETAVSLWSHPIPQALWTELKAEGLIPPSAKEPVA